MKPFIWESYFATGVAEVDRQHSYLVDLINKFTKLFAGNAVLFEDIEGVLEELKEYALYHFQEEERLMAEAEIDPRFLSQHIEVHQDFLAKVNSLHEQMLLENPSSAKHLLEFLIHWLVYHMLGMDQNMARQLAAIKKGYTAEQAFAAASKQIDSATAALLSALSHLFQQVSERNEELHRLNKTLEEQVAKRTQALQEANLHLAQLSVTDVLTDLPNRRYAISHLSALWKRAQLKNEELSCLLIDADHFKQINDKYGHAAGDNVLIELALQLKQTLRTDDVVCRVGGDEFLVICEDTDFAGAMHIAQLLCDAVAELKVAFGKGTWFGSISIGVASKQAQMREMDDLIKMADQGLYLAKEAGKNCVRSISEWPKKSGETA